MPNEAVEKPDFCKKSRGNGDGPRFSEFDVYINRGLSPFPLHSLGFILVNIFTPLFLLFLIGLFHMDTSRADGGSALQPVQIEYKNGWVNLGLPIVMHKRLQDSEFDGLIVQAVGSFNGVPIGIFVAIPDVWDQGTYDNGMPSPHWLGAVNILRFGAASDNLIGSLIELYKLPATNNRASDSVVAPVVLLGERPNLNSKMPLNIKGFFKGDTEDDYGELYIDIVFTEEMLWLKEKDPEYRRAIVKVLRTDGQAKP